MSIVILDAGTLGNDVSWKVFEKFSSLQIYDATPLEKVVSRACDATIIIVNKIPISRQLLTMLPKLRMVCLTATGANNVDLEAAKDLHIQVRNVAGYSTESVAQHTVGMLLYLLENLSRYDVYVKSRKYSQSQFFSYLAHPFLELKGRRWGIIGLGAIGRRVSELATAFGCEVVYTSTSQVSRQEKVPRVSLQQLLESSFVISIHAPLNPRTHDLIGERELSWISPESILLNLGRGGIIHEAALAAALNEGKLRGAGLDVLTHEPIQPDNPLLDLKDPHRLLITPHIGWGSVEARTRLIQGVADNIQDFLNGGSCNLLT